MVLPLPFQACMQTGGRKGSFLPFTGHRQRHKAKRAAQNLPWGLPLPCTCVRGLDSTKMTSQSCRTRSHKTILHRTNVAYSRSGEGGGCILTGKENRDKWDKAAVRSQVTLADWSGWLQHDLIKGTTCPVRTITTFDLFNL